MRDQKNCLFCYLAPNKMCDQPFSCVENFKSTSFDDEVGKVGKFGFDNGDHSTSLDGYNRRIISAPFSQGVNMS